MSTLKDQGMRYVARNGSFAWRHALEMQPGDVDCTDMSDSQFEVYVMETIQVPDAMVKAFMATWYGETGAYLQPEDMPEVRNALMAAMSASPKDAIDSETWRDLVMSADDLLGRAWSAALKMGLSGRGSDCGLSHEVRMFALHFSPEGRDGPGELQVTGTGTFLAWRKAARSAIDKATS